MKPETVKRGETISVPVEVYADPDGLIDGTQAVRAVLKAAPDAVPPGDAAPDAAVATIEWRASLGTGLQKGWLCRIDTESLAAMAGDGSGGLYTFDFRAVIGGGVVYSATKLFRIVERVTEAA